MCVLCLLFLNSIQITAYEGFEISCIIFFSRSHSWIMGRIFLRHIGGTRVFSCASCDTQLTNRSELISTRFTGKLVECLCQIVHAWRKLHLVYVLVCVCVCMCMCVCVHACMCVCIAYRGFPTRMVYLFNIIMFEIHHSGREPSQCSVSVFM